MTTRPTTRPAPPPTADLLFPTHAGVAPRGPAADAADARPARPPMVRLRVEPWPDPVIDRLGVDPRSGYVEQFWLGLVGPASVLLVRHWADRFDLEPDGFELDVAHTAALLGLGSSLGRWGPMQRTIHRCIGFGFARRWSEERLIVRRRIPPLTRVQPGRLPLERQRAHDRWLAAQAAHTAQATQGSR